MIEIRHPRDNISDTRTAYDAIYRDEGLHLQADSFFEWVIELCQPQPGKQLLDVCCGVGQSLPIARRYGLQAVGVDFSRAAVEHAQQRGAAWVGDAEQLPVASASFDYVINLGSLEHLEDMAQGVREMARVLKPDGTCIIMVPNTFGRFWTIWYVGLHGDVPDDGQPLQRYGTSQQWKRLLEANGLQVTDIFPYELPPPRTVQQWATYLRKPKRYLPKLLSPYYMSVHLASMFVFRCTRTDRERQ